MKRAALALAFGGGLMVAALILPRLLDTTPDRTTMLVGASALHAAEAGLQVVDRGVGR